MSAKSVPLAVVLALAVANPARADDKAYVRSVYDRVEASIQAGMDSLAAKRTLPVFG